MSAKKLKLLKPSTGKSQRGERRQQSGRMGRGGRGEGGEEEVNSAFINSFSFVVFSTSN